MDAFASIELSAKVNMGAAMDFLDVDDRDRLTTGSINQEQTVVDDGLVARHEGNRAVDIMWLRLEINDDERRSSHNHLTLRHLVPPSHANTFFNPRIVRVNESYLLHELTISVMSIRCFVTSP